MAKSQSMNKEKRSYKIRYETDKILLFTQINQISDLFLLNP
jgi:hypothetical protein